MTQFPGRRRRRTALSALISAAAVSLGLAGCAATPDDAGTAIPAGSSEDLLLVSMNVYSGILISLPAYIAEEEGFFKEEGLEVTQIAFDSAPAAFQAQMSGAVDIVTSAVSVPLATQEQLDMTGEDQNLLSVLGSIGPFYYGLIGANGVDWPDADDPEVTLAALKGKRVGVASLGADTHNVLLGLARHYGLDPETIDFVAVGLGSGAIAALESGQVDALVAAPPTSDLLVEDGSGTMLMDLREGGVDIFEPAQYADSYALESWLDSHEEAAERWQNAMVRAVEFAEDPANIDRVVEIYALGSETDAAALKPQVEAFIPLYRTEVDCTGVEAVSEFYVDYARTLTKKVTCDEYLWSGADRFRR